MKKIECKHFSVYAYTVGDIREFIDWLRRVLPEKNLEMYCMATGVSNFANSDDSILVGDKASLEFHHFKSDALLTVKNCCPKAFQ